ncbi:protein terminal ear1 homolog [Gastrolobium bilobum]|uniref:protein terminal ear1 homolog n=1 Tax=Gastrolobium bilobum TaxID=150636 RepID=UPI002AB0F067|nr:protein terminal ear1 homolog [Gastrolobium bilobum]
MGETGIVVRFPGNLDPRAEEFRPTNIIQHQPATVFPQPYPCPYAPLPVAVGVPFTHFTAYVTPPAQVSTSPTRSLLLSPVPIIISESALRMELEVFGDVRGIQMDGLRDGTVTVHFYDLRHAETALTAIRRQHMQHQTRLRNHYASFFKTLNPEFYAAAPPPLPPPARGLISGRVVWAQYVQPACNAVPDGQNQGTLVIFNLDMEVSTENLRQVFKAFGAIKELRDTPWKKNQRFVEFFDIRDAAKALKEMNGKEINGKQVVIEFSRPGGHTRKFFHSSPHSTISKKPLNFNIPSPPSPSPRAASSPRRRFAGSRLHSSHQPQLSYKKSAVDQNKISDSGSIDASITKQQQQQLPRSNRNWKGKQAKKLETRFLIKEDAIVESTSRDSRTTVMIKNIPNKYSQKLLLNMLDNHCIHCNEQIGDDDDQPLSSYDFVYLPIDFNNKCNVGYGFVNMTSPEATLRLYKAFHLQHWEVFNSRKICEVTYARVQGLEALKEHFKNSKFPCEMEHYLPVVFSPPRDGGRELTEPLPIVGNKQQTIGVTNISNGVGCDEMEGGDRDDRVGGGVSACDDVASSKSGGVSSDDDTREVGGGGMLSSEVCSVVD